MPKNVAAEIEIQMEKPICIEVSKSSKELGRFTLRSGVTVVGAGVVVEILNRVK